MFTNFKRFFYNLISEGNKFSELPDKKPYGFWIDPGGDFWIVPFQQHENVGLKIINRNPRYKDEYNSSPEKNNASYWLINKGYVRVNMTHVLDYNAKATPNRSQSQTIMDLAEFYGLRPENADNATSYEKGRAQRDFNRSNLG